MAATLPTRIVQAQAESLCPHDFLANLVQDELHRRADRLIERRVKHAGFRDRGRTLDNFDFAFNPRMDKKLIFELASCRFVAEQKDGLFLGPPGTGKSHLAQAIGLAAIHHGYDVLYREAHALVEQLADATLDGTRKDFLQQIGSAKLLIIDDLGMRKLPHTAAEDLLEVVMRRYERASTIMTSNRPDPAPVVWTRGLVRWQVTSEAGPSQQRGGTENASVHECWGAARSERPPGERGARRCGGGSPRF